MQKNFRRSRLLHSYKRCSRAGDSPASSIPVPSWPTPRPSRAAWKRAFAEAYEGFCDSVDRGHDTWLDPYAAEHESEFFAVLSEAFFREASETQRRYPDVYDQLKLFYRQDPAART